MPTDKHRDRRLVYPWAGVLAGFVLVVAAAWAVEFVPGDVNDDGAFDVGDTTVLRRALAELGPGISQMCVGEPPPPTGLCPGAAAPASVIVTPPGAASGPWSRICGGGATIQPVPCGAFCVPTAWTGTADALVLMRALEVGGSILVAHRFRLESDLGELSASVRSVSIQPLQFDGGTAGAPNPWTPLIPGSPKPLEITITATVSGGLPTAASRWWLAVLNGSAGGGPRSFAVQPTSEDSNDIAGVRFGGIGCFPKHWSVEAASKGALTETLLVECSGAQVSAAEPVLGKFLSNTIQGLSSARRTVRVAYARAPTSPTIDYLQVFPSGYVFPQFDRTLVDVPLEEGFFLQSERIQPAP